MKPNIMVRQYHQAASALQRRVPRSPAHRGGAADGPGSATRVPLMAVESDRSGGRAANTPARPGIEGSRASETMLRAVVVFVGRAV